MDAKPGLLPLFLPESGTGLWIGSADGETFLNPEESIRFFILEGGLDSNGAAAWSPLETPKDLPAGQWPQTDSKAVLALLDAHVQNPEEWVPPRDEKCRIVCVQESALSRDSFLRCVLLFDCVGIDGAWFSTPCSGADANPWHAFAEKIKNCQFWESLVGVMDSFEDVILYRIGIDGVIHYITPNVERYGFVAKEVIGLPLMRFVHPEDLSLVAQSFADIEALQKNPVRFRVLGPQGQTFYVRTSSRFVPDSGRPLELVGIMREETGQMQASLQLERARRIASVMHQVSGVLFGAASLEDLCSSVCRILVEEESVTMALVQNAEAPGSAMGMWHDRLGKDCRGFLSREFLEFLGRRSVSQPETIRFYQHEPDFKRFLIQTELAGVRSILAMPLGYSGYRFSGKLFLFAQSTDAFDLQAMELMQQVAMLLTHGILAILDRQEADRVRERLSASEERHRYVLSNIRDIIYSFDSESRLQFLSENVREVFGADPQRLLGKHFVELGQAFPGMDPQVFTDLQMNFDAAVSEKKTEIFFPIVWGEGENRRFLEISERIFYHTDGSLQGTTGIIRDVTQRVLVQKELERSEEKYRLLFEMSQDAIFIEDMNGRILECNEAALRMYGFSRSEMMQLCAADLVPESIMDKFPDLARCLREDGGFLLEARNRRKDGTEFPIEISARLFHLHGEERIMLSIRDISEHKQREKEQVEAERRLRQRQKMESVSLLVSRLAHDFNNLLVGILGNASLGLMETAKLHPAWLPLQEIEKAAEEASMISRKLLMYAGGWKPHLQPVNLAEILERSAKDLQSAIPEHVRVMYRIDPGAFPVSADPEHCFILISHLTANAIDAVKQKNSGLVTISLFFCSSLPENPAMEIAPDNFDRKNDWVCLEVADSGCGIAPQHLEMIFDPFFTTKEGATGLGLAAVAGIVRHHKAVLQVAKLGTQGTAFRVFFTAEKDAAPQDGATLQTTMEEPEEGTVLLVDDDLWVRTVGKRMLASARKPCIAVPDGHQALSQAAQNLQKIRLVVLDLHLPDIDGTEVFKQLRALRPDLPILVSSGWSDRIEPFWDQKEAFCTGTLPKPYTASAFLQAIEALESAASKKHIPS